MADDLWEHPDWARQKTDDGKDDDDGPSLEYIDLDTINNGVVKLTFKRFGEAEPLSGSGFFLNLPDIQDKHVILTAAHNLISNQQRSLDLKVIYNNPFEIDPDNPKKVKFADNKHGAIIEVPVDNTEGSRHVHICEGYKREGDPSVDYGVITIPRTSAKGPRGFGFSLPLAYGMSFMGNVYVSGFKIDNSMPPIKKTLRPATSLAFNMTYNGNHVEYQTTTEKGMRGSPVWVEYQKYLAVIAIQ
jgi:V8-like Glu-specific endopeptidase